MKTFPITNAAPANLEWDGTNDSGRVVPDGVYRYGISAVDKALNEGSRITSYNVCYTKLLRNKVVRT